MLLNSYINIQIGLDMKLGALFYYPNTSTKMLNFIIWKNTIPILSLFCDRKC